MEFCKSSVPELEEPLHVVGLKKEWQNFTKKFYQDNGLVHEYKNGRYNINFSLTGFDRNPLTSLIMEAKKERNVTIDDVVDMNSEQAKNYNHYGFSLLYDEEVRKKMQLLNIDVKIFRHR